ncbi:hypothetical protein H4R34_003069 [Dimargaris verticillata]|uniref:RRM domain-containing protein n=1 Tax=Dimargaris verticillata TaxID=2761393 RepID=A0A9W8B7L2_9FUNG|nr:hypothetical protein H4R34_003069 [Dimargaris verticillata]
MIKRTGIDPDRLVDVHIRYNKYLLPVGKAVLEFDSTQSASEFLAKGGQQTLAGQTLRMSSMDRDIDPSRLRPEVIGDAYGRCVLVYGFPKQITDSEMFEYFKSYQLAEQTESAIQRLPL